MGTPVEGALTRGVEGEAEASLFLCNFSGLRDTRNFGGGEPTPVLDGFGETPRGDVEELRGGATTGVLTKMRTSTNRRVKNFSERLT